jgi:hypothetical protein
MKKTEFTKKIMIAAIVINICVTVFACVMMWRTEDLSPLGYMLTADGGALSVAFGAYAWKEKAANRNKYAMLYVDKIAVEHGMDTALQMAEIVLRD